MNQRKNNRRIDHHDIILGARLRKVRRKCGWTLQDLADGVGVSFQQIQKYEKGINRIPATRLWQFSKVLKVPIRYFFCAFD